jgi:phenylpropionate dioxygenase-like ring-hydroxylating dioxygenase large terminal subunit
MEAALKTLPARYYTDPELHRTEIERFFFESWMYAGRADAIPNPGDYFLREVAAESVIVVRGQDRVIRAFYNVCRHRGARMCTVEEGNFTGRIQCPYHAWSYLLDGTLAGAPHMDPATFRHADYPLREIRTGLWDGHIFLHFGENPQPFRAYLADLPEKFSAWGMEDLRLYKRMTYELQANWKLVVLNYSECLHCPIVHPALNLLTDYLGADNEAPQPSYLGGAMGFRNGAETMTFSGKRRHDYLPGLSEAERQKVCYYAIYPNLLLCLAPDYMMTHVLWPRAVDRTEVVCDLYFHPAEMAKPGFDASDIAKFWDLTNREDWRVVELSQAGIQSRAYTPGPYSPREHLLAAFDQTVVERDSARESPHGKSGE